MHEALIPTVCPDPDKLLAQLDTILLELKDIAQEAERKEKLQLPVPETLYHATPAMFVPNILQKGIFAMDLPGCDKPVVCLSDSESFAVEVAKLTQQNLGKIAVFSVNSRFLYPSLVQNYLSADDELNGTTGIREVRYTGDIPRYALVLK